MFAGAAFWTLYRQLQDQLRESKREADERRRAQAVLVYMWVPASVYANPIHDVTERGFVRGRAYEEVTGSRDEDGRDENMADGSAIEWTAATWNPTTGCDRISAGCDHCYALALAARLKAMGQPKYQNDGDPRTSGPGFGVTVHPAALGIPKRWREPRLVFVNSMSDLFHARVPLSFIRDVFTVITDTPQHTYQVLTKRASRLPRIADKLEWPPNLWVGVSVEDASELPRVDQLRAVGAAALRFLSCEPLLGPLDSLDLADIGWVIAGGESGPRFRPLHPDWLRDIRDRCVTEEVPFFFKQWGGRTPKAGGRELDGRMWNEMPIGQVPAAPPDHRTVTQTEGKSGS